MFPMVTSLLSVKQLGEPEPEPEPGGWLRESPDAEEKACPAACSGEGKPPSSRA